MTGQSVLPACGSVEFTGASSVRPRRRDMRCVSSRGKAGFPGHWEFDGQPTHEFSAGGDFYLTFKNHHRAVLAPLPSSAHEAGTEYLPIIADVWDGIRIS